MSLPGFKTTTTNRTIILNAAIHSVFSYLQAKYKLVSLGELTSISTGATPTRSKPSFYGGTIPWVKINDITNSGRWLNLTDEFITEDALNNSPIRWLERGTVLLSKTGTIGKVAIAAKPLTTNQAVFGIAPKSNITSEYLYYCLINARESLIAQGQGAMVINLSVKAVKNLLIPLPPLNIINSVVQFLAAIEDGQSLPQIIDMPVFLHEKIQKLEKLFQINNNIEKIQSLKIDSENKFTDFVQSLNFSLSHKQVTLKELLLIDELKQEVHPDNEYPLVGIKNFGGGLFPKDIIQGKQTTYKYLNRLYQGAIVMSQLKAWEGAIAICGVDLADKYVSPEYRTFRCVSEQAIPEYLITIFTTPWFLSQVKNITTGIGGRRERTKLEQFLSIRIAIPTIKQQKEVVIIFEKIAKLKCLKATTTNDLDSLLPSALNKVLKF